MIYVVYFLSLALFSCFFTLSFVLILDIDECASDKHNCSEDAVCNNTKGSFNCACKPGFTGNGYKCAGEHHMYFCCANNYYKNFKNGKQCRTQTQVGSGLPWCSYLKFNLNRLVSFCFVLFGLFLFCFLIYYFFLRFLDIDECATGTRNCSDHAVCNNTKGGHNCTCKLGFTGDGWNCTGELAFQAFGFLLATFLPQPSDVLLLVGNHFNT